MAPDLMAQGVELMLAGMGTVFVFLTVLVVATVIMSRIVMLIEGPQGVPGEAQSEREAEEIAVITAAVEAHRRRQLD